MPVNNKSKLQSRILVALIAIGIMVLALLAILRINVFGVKMTRIYEYQESGFVSWLNLTKTEFYGDDTMKLYGITSESAFDKAVFYDADFNVLEGDYSVSFEGDVCTINAEFASRINHILFDNGNSEFRYLCSEQYALMDTAIVMDGENYPCYYGADYFTDEEKAAMQEREQRIADKYASLVGCFESADGDRIYFSDLDGEKHMELVYSDGLGYGVTITEITEDEKDPDVLRLRSTYYRGWAVEKYSVRLGESDGEALTVSGPFGGEYKKVSDTNERVYENNFGPLAGKWRRIDDRSDEDLEYVDEIEFTDDSILYNGSKAILVDLVVCQNNYKLSEGRYHDVFSRGEDYSYYMGWLYSGGLYITLSEDNNVMTYELYADGQNAPYVTLMFERK